MIVQKLVSERSRLTSRVDEVRDVAVELINRSSKHEESVELQLTAFNQRWQDIDARIKVFTRLSLCVSYNTAVKVVLYEVLGEVHDLILVEY